LSEKRPETTKDIVTRSAALSLRELSHEMDARARRSRKRGTYTVDLPGHLAQCDANYHQLLRLFPQLRDVDHQAFALPVAGADAKVHFRVLERGPYTTTVHIAVKGASNWLDLATPELSVRAYHDALSAEVVSYQDENRFHGAYEYPNTRMRQRDEKAQLNRFLGEFLALLLSHGVSAEPISF